MLSRMGRKKRAAATGGATTDSAMRDQEVLRANRELAAYFKGRRTEREARAALKIIKAFVRDRERQDAKSRAPLPGLAPPKPAVPDRPAPKKTRRRRARVRATAPTGTDASPLRDAGLDSPDRAPE
jgi:hypothetical protein